MNDQGDGFLLEYVNLSVQIVMKIEGFFLELCHQGNVMMVWWCGGGFQDKFELPK